MSFDLRAARRCTKIFEASAQFSLWSEPWIERGSNAKNNIMRLFNDVAEQVGLDVRSSFTSRKGVIVPDTSPTLELEMTYIPTHSAKIMTSSGECSRVT